MEVQLLNYWKNEKCLKMQKQDTLNQHLEHSCSLEKKVAFLKQATAYSFPVNRIETKETHMSWVFLVNGLVYKLKKNCSYLLLDLTTLESRYFNCMEEVRLNRRLAPEIYLGVIALCIEKNGELKLEGKGEIIDWLVKMKRIPDEDMLDQAIENKKINKEMIGPAANLLVNFYKHSAPIVMNAEQFKEKLKHEIDIIYKEIIDPLLGLPEVIIDQINETLVTFLKENAAVFDKRINEGRVIEAHGDLKPEHIYVGTHPAIIDCLEFSRDLRLLDSAEELSFLDIECERLGDFTTGKMFFDIYREQMGNQIPEALIYFYKSKRAFLRTYLVIRHIKESHYKDNPKWRNTAHIYLNLSEKYCKQLEVD